MNKIRLLFCILQVIFCFLYQSCSNTQTDTLVIQTKSELINKSIISNPIKIMKVSYFNDSIIVQRIFSNHRSFSNKYLIESGQVYDYRYKDEVYLTNRDRLLFLSNKCDTTYEWKNYYLRYFIIGLDRRGTKVIINQISDNLFKTELISKSDSSYRERYYYDQSYHLKKFEYIYKGFKVTLENKNR